MIGSKEVQAAFATGKLEAAAFESNATSFAETSLRDSDESLDSAECSEGGDDVWELPVMPTRQKSDSFANPILRSPLAMPKRQQSAPSPLIAKLNAGEPSRIENIASSMDPYLAKDTAFDDVILTSFQPGRQMTDSLSLPDEGFCRQETEQFWPVWPPLQAPPASVDNGLNVAKTIDTTVPFPEMQPSTCGEAAGKSPTLPFGDVPAGNTGVGMLTSTAITQMMMMQACASSALQYMASDIPADSELDLDAKGQEVPDNSAMNRRRKFPSLIDLAAEKQQQQQQLAGKPQQQRKKDQKKLKPKSTFPMGARGAPVAPVAQQGGAPGDASMPRVPKFCPYCGGKALHQFKFCQFCGENLIAFHNKHSA